MHHMISTMQPWGGLCCAFCYILVHVYADVFLQAVIYSLLLIKECGSYVKLWRMTRRMKSPSDNCCNIPSWCLSFFGKAQFMTRGLWHFKDICTFKGIVDLPETWSKVKNCTAMMILLPSFGQWPLSNFKYYFQSTWFKLVKTLTAFVCLPMIKSSHCSNKHT